ncbi:hypothetical protein ANANG_G00253400, partial [Anguilla anguilla]
SGRAPQRGRRGGEGARGHGQGEEVAPLERVRGDGDEQDPAEQRAQAHLPLALHAWAERGPLTGERRLLTGK